VKLHLGEGYLSELSGDIAFRTPGLHPELPELRALRDRGTVITSEMEAFFTVCPCTMIGVTGSDGKTTTTTLISEMLKDEGTCVWVGGNIGTPLLNRASEMKPEDIAVLELSSFQLMNMPFSPHIAVVTNLAPNHLDMHRDMAEYVAAKKNIYLHQTPQDVLIVNMDHEITDRFAQEAVGRVLKFSRKGEPARGVFLKDGVIYRKSVQENGCGSQARGYSAAGNAQCRKLYGCHCSNRGDGIRRNRTPCCGKLWRRGAQD
jgi:UDP-N-acetylmuramoylalanine--D-glutamate ligase